VGSIGDNRLGGWYGYRMSKAAHNMGLRTLAIELKRQHRGLLCVALHPGTVATALSAPFRKADDPKLLTPEASAAALLRTVSGLSPADHGGFFAYDGQPIPW
jgi:NAD(P)-dependent dehydrogenase (short-subunit alcohol dehydrogenase family)